MSEHLKSNTVGDTIPVWCQTCGRQTKRTIYRVSTENMAGKPGPCTEHSPKVNRRGESKKQETARQTRERLREQPSLFGDRK